MFPSNKNKGHVGSLGFVVGNDGMVSILNLKVFFLVPYPTNKIQ